MNDAMSAAFHDELEKIAGLGDAYAETKEGVKSFGRMLHQDAKSIKDSRVGKVVADVASRGAKSAVRNVKKVGKRIASSKVGRMTADAARGFKSKAGVATLLGASAIGAGGTGIHTALKDAPPPTKREQTITKLKRGRQREKERKWSDADFKKELRRQRSDKPSNDPKVKAQRKATNITQMTKALKSRRIKRGINRAMPAKLRMKR
jgi:hypothetical protein